MTSVFPEGLVEDVAKAMFHVGYPMTSFAWESSHLKPIYRERARAALSVSLPCVAGLIADRLDERYAERSGDDFHSTIWDFARRDGLVDAAALVRREFGGET